MDLKQISKATVLEKRQNTIPLHQELGSKYKQIKFINVSLGVLGTVGSSSESFINLLKYLEVSQPTNCLFDRR